MAPLPNMGIFDKQAAVSADWYSSGDARQAADYSSNSIYVMVLSVILVVCAIVISTLFICVCCCGDDEAKKRAQEAADAAVLPPPVDIASDRSVSEIDRADRKTSTPPAKKDGYVVLIPKRPPGPAPLLPVPKEEARQYMTMAPADSVVFDKSQNNAGKFAAGNKVKANVKKMPAPKSTVPATGAAPLETMAMANSKVFDKPGSKKQAQAPPPSETMALADSKVFDKK